jgi:CheY-like chemotaxis protein
MGGSWLGSEPSIPVGQNEPQEVGGRSEDKARAAGHDDYVTEPYKPRQLLAKIKEQLPLGGLASGL